jgi:hypothetical protein
VASADPAAIAARLLEEYDTYDQHVDVVSAFEWLFTDPAVEGLPETVAHFERFPSIPRADGDPLTPDFTVLFKDGTAIIGEIAKIALHENSVDKLCQQIGNYDAMDRVPNAAGGLTEVEHPDVLQLVRNQNGLTTVRRVIVERYLNPDHPYKPSRAPCIAQFSRTDTHYAFQRLQNPENGTLSTPAGREPNIAKYLDSDWAAPAGRFVGIKAARAFINDPVKPLYLATHLWTRTWPTQHGSGKEDIVVDPTATADLIRSQYGLVRATDVRKALELLQAAGLSAPDSDGTWTVSRKLLGRSGDRDVHKLIAKRIAKGSPKLVTRKPAPADAVVADTLFDL